MSMPNDDNQIKGPGATPKAPDKLSSLELDIKKPAPPTMMFSNGRHVPQLSFDESKTSLIETPKDPSKTK